MDDGAVRRSPDPGLTTNTHAVLLYCLDTLTLARDYVNASMARFLQIQELLDFRKLTVELGVRDPEFWITGPFARGEPARHLDLVLVAHLEAHHRTVIERRPFGFLNWTAVEYDELRPTPQGLDAGTTRIDYVADALSNYVRGFVGCWLRNLEPTAPPLGLQRHLVLAPGYATDPAARSCLERQFDAHVAASTTQLMSGAEAHP